MRHYGWILKIKIENFTPFYFLLNDSRIQLVLDYTCILRLIIHALLKHSRFQGHSVNTAIPCGPLATGFHWNDSKLSS